MARNTGWIVGGLVGVSLVLGACSSQNAAEKECNDIAARAEAAANKTGKKKPANADMIKSALLSACKKASASDRACFKGKTTREQMQPCWGPIMKAAGFPVFGADKKRHPPPKKP